MQPPGIEGNNNDDDDDDLDVWVEHKTSDGNVYYSDPKTQKTTWEKPSGVKIVPFTPTGSLVGQDDRQTGLRNICMCVAIPP